MINPIVAFIGICVGLYALGVAFYIVCMIIVLLISTAYIWVPAGIIVFIAVLLLTPEE